MDQSNFSLSQALHEYRSGRVVAGGGRHILVACMPKSASTFLAKSIACVPTYRPARLVPLHGRREQELDVLHCASLHNANYVAQHHVRYSEATDLILKRFCIYPVILTRNIFDCIVSLCDHLNNESDVIPMGYVSKAILERPRDFQLDAVIDLCAPWLLNFVACWSEYRGRCLWISYDDVVQNPNAVIRTIMTELNDPIRDDEIDAAVIAAKSGNVRLNVGRPGRGAEELSFEQIQRVQRLCSYFADNERVRAICELPNIT